MAFYPDELSPIDRSRNIGGKASDYPDINLIKNRRQWKSLVLGKKDLGMNSFATIAEEREEEISSDEGEVPGAEIGGYGKAAAVGVVPHKKIIFPRPRKYIGSRVAVARKEESRDSPPLTSPVSGNPSDDLLVINRKKSLGEILSTSSFSSKPSLTDVKLLAQKSRELLPQRLMFMENYSLNQPSLSGQWNEAVAATELLTGWPKAKQEKPPPTRHDSLGRGRQEEKKKASGTAKPPAMNAAKEAKNRKGSSGPSKMALGVGQFGHPGQSPRLWRELPAARAGNAGLEKGKRERGRNLNMKDVVNVYKNLAYGSKEEIKSFVETLSFVKDESENDKNMLSMMNLKVLENKIKNIAKKTTEKSGDASSSVERKAKSGDDSSTGGRKPKGGKLSKKNRKAHIERLARHKGSRVPGLASIISGGAGRATPQSRKISQTKSALKNKEPWKYVGMQSALDKTYLVYPSYPLHPSATLRDKKAGRKSKGGGRDSEDSGDKKAEAEAEVAPAASAAATATAPELRPGSKVKRSDVVLKSNLLFRGGAAGATRSSNALNASASSKSMNRPSATTVCNVQFRPESAQRRPAENSDPGLLLYLHGSKALNVRTPYADKQFSRVKFLRKNGKGVPLVRGLRREGPARSQDAANVAAYLAGVRSLDLLDFDEDIENINTFLRSQKPRPSPKGQEEREALKKSERDWFPREASRLQRRPRRSAHHQLQHQHGTPPPALSPDSIVSEISKHIQHFQYLPDTEVNRKMIAAFFEELDHRIEASKSSGDAAFANNLSSLSRGVFGPIPILGY